MNQGELIPHLFRTEFSKLTAVLCKQFGLEHMETAEDIVSDTFLAALETWTYKGIPENPAAWLYTVAKNKTKNKIKRDGVFKEKLIRTINPGMSADNEFDIDLSEQNFKDSQLQMLFALCHPALQGEAQIGLALRILCGFSIEEIAGAFLTNKETINKRLFRAKEKLRQEKIAIILPPEEEIDKRLDNVLTTIYLLYNEGYYSETNDNVMREDLCAEAMRLATLLLENEKTNRPKVNALLSLMCFQSSRFAARRNEQGQSFLLYHDQDELKWNQDLIAQGAYYLKLSAQGEELSKYHLEAGIAYWHTIKADTNEKWESILQLYNQLLQIEYSPIAALNRTWALSKANSKEEAIKEAEKLKLTNNHFYYTLLGELYKDIDAKKAISHFEKAFVLAKTENDKRTIQTKLKDLSH